ncbi:MAG TPA: hypothetical protein VMJ64_01345 [Anaerolineales bacterium]|nr:hypothetical protein [Anaerolineales bacterium]
MVGITIFCLVVYLLGTWLVTRLSARLRSIGFIKVIHLAIFVLISGLLVGFLYEVVTGRMNYLTWSTIGILLGEGVVLVTNRWRCPLTAVAEGLGSEHGQVTDILLPKSIADHVWTIYTWLFAGGLLVLVIRLLW